MVYLTICVAYLQNIWRYGVVVSTVDFDSTNPSSNLGTAFSRFYSMYSPPRKGWRKVSCILLVLLGFRSLCLSHATRKQHGHSSKGNVGSGEVPRLKLRMPRAPLLCLPCAPGWRGSTRASVWLWRLLPLPHAPHWAALPHPVPWHLPQAPHLGRHCDLHILVLRCECGRGGASSRGRIWNGVRPPALCCVCRQGPFLPLLPSSY